jgi:hypothetical protein
MPTHCTQDSFDFGKVEGRCVVADFGGGTITSNAGALLLGKADRAVGVIDRFAACFGDGRNQGLIEHTTRTMVGQRVIGIALGHEDLRSDSILDPRPLVLVTRRSLFLAIGRLPAGFPVASTMTGVPTMSSMAEHVHGKEGKGDQHPDPIR